MYDKISSTAISDLAERVAASQETISSLTRITNAEDFRNNQEFKLVDKQMCNLFL